MITLFVIPAIGQSSKLVLKSGKAVVKKVLEPKKEDAANFYSLSAKKGQTLEVKTSAKSVVLGDENECGIVFLIYDNQKNVVTDGDYPEGGASEWKGAIRKTGIYQIKVFMGCLEAYSEEELKKKKPGFRYSLEILLK